MQTAHQSAKRTAMQSAVEKLIATYRHTEIGALEAIDAAFATVPDAIPTALEDGSARLATVDDVSPPN